MAGRSDPWHCAECDAMADLAPRAAEVGVVRLAANGAAGFDLGSAGIEPLVAPLLAACACGGRLAPGPGAAPPVRARFDAELLRPVAERGWAVLEATDEPRLVALRGPWRPRLLPLLGREGELEREEVLRARLEEKLERLQHEVEHAGAVGDGDAAEAAHARYIELGTTYVRRFVAGDARAAS